ncbi:MAG: type II toxin-antitoxin system VapC family toxin [Nevskia sp.]|nr:type II toxin-antitoxin system VapC family toxin [Nevskia sp.]
MRLLLDTHVAVWWQLESLRLGVEARHLIQHSDEPAFISHVSLWELAIKVSIGKLHLDLRQFCERIVDDGFHWLPIKETHLLAVAEMPLGDDHQDPFDRLLVAQSLTEPLILLTADKTLARYGSTVKVV